MSTSIPKERLDHLLVSLFGLVCALDDVAANITNGQNCLVANCGPFFVRFIRIKLPTLQNSDILFSQTHYSTDTSTIVVLIPFRFNNVSQHGDTPTIRRREKSLVSDAPLQRSAVSVSHFWQEAAYPHIARTLYPACSPSLIMLPSPICGAGEAASTSVSAIHTKCLAEALRESDSGGHRLCDGIETLCLILRGAERPLLAISDRDSDALSPSCRTNIQGRRISDAKVKSGNLCTALRREL
jgi:hypothetical protein